MEWKVWASELGGRSARARARARVHAHAHAHAHARARARARAHPLPRGVATDRSRSRTVDGHSGVHERRLEHPHRRQQDVHGKQPLVPERRRSWCAAHPRCVWIIDDALGSPARVESRRGFVFRQRVWRAVVCLCFVRGRQVVLRDRADMRCPGSAWLGRCAVRTVRCDTLTHATPHPRMHFLPHTHTHPSVTRLPPSTRWYILSLVPQLWRCVEVWHRLRRRPQLMGVRRKSRAAVARGPHFLGQEVANGALPAPVTVARRARSLSPALCHRRSMSFSSSFRVSRHVCCVVFRATCPLCRSCRCNRFPR
jgi:hypothetical protein